MTKIENPWLEFVETGKTVASMDATFVEQYNARVKNPKHKLQLQCEPAPYCGGLDSASVVFLLANPGYAPDGFVPHPKWMYEVKANHANPHSHIGFAGIDPDLAYGIQNGQQTIDPGYRWWTSHLRPLSERCGDLRGHIMSIEWHPYHSQCFRAPSQPFPSQQFTFNLVSQAMAQGKLIVILRCDKLWFASVPGLEQYPNRLEIKNKRNVVISPNNFRDGGFEKIVAAIMAKRRTQTK